MRKVIIFMLFNLIMLSACLQAVGARAKVTHLRA